MSAVPNGVTVEQKLYPVRQVREVHGTLVPWEVNGYFEDFEKSRTRGGIFDLTHWGTVTVDGPDAADFLQRMSTVDVRKLAPGRVVHGAFLTGRGNPVAMGWLFRRGAESFRFVAPPPSAAAAAEHVEKFHFAERFTSADVSGETAVFGLWRPEESVLADAGIPPDSSPLEVFAASWEGIPSESWRDDVLAPLFWVTMERHRAAEWFSQMRAHGVELLGQRLFEYFRIAAAVPQVGEELGEKEIILEGNFDRVVARDKGCYPGQEVVERIFTYGSVNRKLFPMLVRGAGAPTPAPLKVDGAVAGILVNAAEMPDRPGTALGLGFLQKHFWSHQGEFSVEGGGTASVRPPSLP